MRAGFSLIEVIISSALVLLLATLFLGAVVSGEKGAVASGMRARANLVAEEGLEAVRNLRDSTFLNLTDGTWGIGQASGQWALVGTSDTEGPFTRSVSIATLDTSTKMVTSTVSWLNFDGSTSTVTLVDRLIDTSLLVPQIKSLQVDVSGGHISSNNRLVGVKIKNIGNDGITLATTTVSWVGGSAESLTEIDINGKTVWAPASNIGFPTTTQPSGGSEGLTGVTMSPNSANPINNFVFDNSIHGAYFIIKFVMSDNSSTTITTTVLQ